MWTNPMISVAVFLFLYGTGKVVSKKTKGVLVEAFFLAVMYILGYLLNIIPKESLGDTGIPVLMGTWGTMLLVTNLGTMIELKRFFKEWKTVVVCLGAMVVMAVFFVTLGQVVFGKEYALSALPPVAGGLVANGLVVQAAEAGGKPNFGTFASMLCSTQSLVATPICAYFLHKYVAGVYKDKSYLHPPVENGNFPNLHFFPKWPSDWNIGPLMAARLMLVCVLGVFVSKLSGGKLPSAVMVLVFGILGTEFGFLEKNTLTKAGYMDFLIMGLVLSLPYSFRNLTLSALGSMIVPVLFFLRLGVIGLTLGGVLMGKVLKVDWHLAAAVSLSAMFGYPMTEIISRAVVSSYNLDKEEEEKLLEAVMPQMIIAGFTTVTIASVVLAGIVAPLIFA